MKNLKIKFPVVLNEYVPQIFDANGDLVVDIRGWGRLQYLDNPEQSQDDIGKFIVDAMNEKYEKEKNMSKILYVVANVSKEGTQLMRSITGIYSTEVQALKNVKEEGDVIMTIPLNEDDDNKEKVTGWYPKAESRENAVNYILEKKKAPSLADMSIKEKILALNYTSCTCLHCGYERILEVSDFTYTFKSGVLTVSSPCPRCGEETMFRFLLTLQEYENFASIKTQINEERK